MRWLSSAVLLVVAVALSAPHAAASSIFDPHRHWTITQRLRDNGIGQDFFNYSDSVHSLGRYVAVGATNANAFKGLCRIFYDHGDGLKVVATVKDPAGGTLGDLFGKKVYLFNRNKVMHLAVAALEKNGDGAVMIWRQGASVSTWNYQQEVASPAGTYVYEFGRHILFDDTALLVSAVARYKHSRRFIISSVNVKGTKYFEESTGSDPMAHGDPVITFVTKDGRGNTTRLSHSQTLTGAPYNFDFGASMSLHGDLLAVGAVSRREARFGFGTDGDLVVSSGVKLLDGSAEYNFNNVDIQAGGILTVDNYDEIRGAGGYLKLKIFGRLTIHPNGLINLTAHGRKGAPTKFEASRPEDGKGPGGGITAVSQFTGPLSCLYDGTEAAAGALSAAAFQSKTTRNTTSGIAFAEANGGGGSYGTVGTAGTTVQCGVSGQPGSTYGDAQLSTLEYGSGGGAGQPWKIGSGGSGGDGGGIIEITAKEVFNHGIIENNGGRGADGGFYSGGGGGGSGGTIFLSGLTLANYGHIIAKGGNGGVRATTSGSGGDVNVRGGKGGVGRIRLEFLTTVTIGIVNPAPVNGTAYDGDIYLFNRSVVTKLWEFKAIVPRLPAMLFLGHSVAVHGNKLAIGSAERTAANPRESIFLLDIEHFQNSSSPIYVHREIHPPQGFNDLGFAQKLSLFNDTLVVSSTGHPTLASGRIYIFSGHNLFDHTTKLVTLYSHKDYVGNGYGEDYSYDYPQLLVRVPFDQDDGLASNSRLSIGNVHVWRHIRNISAVHSSITCKYTVATANTSVLCTFHARDELGDPAGDVHDLAKIIDPPYMVYVHEGTYEWLVNLTNVGSHEVYVTYDGKRVPSTFITVSPPIIPHLANFTCSPLNPIAGDVITCLIVALNKAGEENAAAWFRATVYHTDDVTLRDVHQDEWTPVGVYRTPPSGFIPALSLRTDFPTQSPTVTWKRYGIYEFSYTTWRPGPHAAFLQYQGKPVDWPNPVIVDAAEPPVDAARSIIHCPTIAAPKRTVVCMLRLRSSIDVPTGHEGLALNYSSAGRYVRAELDRVPLTVSSLWAQEGRISLLVYPNTTGTLRFHAEHNGSPIPMLPAAGINIAYNYATSCQRMSSIQMSFTVMNQHAMGLTDVSVYGARATRAEYIEGKGMCDDQFV